ncbi:GrlR family regulatory protein [Advenella sp. RU8]|uniref:GrlR family regulatory protein n=1 Tax=Advenella sp. RU8 TaxID=3399575 RepID=UPI003AAF73C0
MDNGFYATWIAESKAHPGITVIEDARIRGGDANYLYSGTIQATTPEEVVANLKIKAYKSQANETFGTLDDTFDLSLTGIKTDSGFEMTGYSPSGKEIKIEATKIANIDL